MVGSTLSHYRVVELLGRGGMGEVYAAEDLRLRRKIAIKVLPAEMASNHERRRRFEREAQAIAALNHPGIVTIHSIEQEQGVAFLTMELVEGTTLGQNVPPAGLPLADFLAVAIPLADAVNAAHERGILHRDLKPSNVMVTRDGRVKILDFGLAKLTERAAEAVALPHGPLTTTDGQIVGTLAYMAPEQAEGKTIDQRADIFALGVMLYELAAGVRPFVGETNVSMLTSLLRDTARPIAEVRRDLPPVLGDILQRCMEKDPAKRYPSAAELRTDLERVRGGVLAIATAPAPPWAYAGAGILVLLMVLGGWWMLRQARPEAAEMQPAMTEQSPATPVLITGRQVAILDFQNQTGDPSLDSFGRMAGEAIAAALIAQGLPVVSATAASAADGVTVAASYTLQANELRFEARLMSASRGIVVRNIDPVSAPRGGFVLAVDEVKRRVVTGILSSLDPTAAR